MPKSDLLELIDCAAKYVIESIQKEGAPVPRKAKKKVHPMPKLSFIDQLIYWTVILLLICMLLAFILLPFYIKHLTAHAEDLVIAHESTISVLWQFVPFIAFLTAFCWCCLLPYTKRIPIFGRRNFKYGPPAWPRIYPLFMKNKPKIWVSQYEKQKKRKRILWLVGLLVLGLITFPLSFFGRECLRSDGGITQYSMFNTQTRAFSSEEITSVVIRAVNFRRKTGVEIKLTTDTGKTYTFDNRDFNLYNPHISHTLEVMLALKNQYDPDIISYKRTDRLDSVIFSYNLTPEEADILYQLFDVQ